MLCWRATEPSFPPVILGAVLQFSSTDLRRRVSSRGEPRTYCLYFQQPPIQWVRGFPSGTKAAGVES